MVRDQNLIHSWHRHTQHTDNHSWRNLAKFQELIRIVTWYVKTFRNVNHSWRNLAICRRTDRYTHTHTSINVLQLVSPQGTFQYNKHLHKIQRILTQLQRTQTHRRYRLLIGLKGKSVSLLNLLPLTTRAVLRLECSLDCLSAPTYRYIAPRMIQRIILKFCGYVGCDDATNVSNFGYEPIKFNQLNQ